MKKNLDAKIFWSCVFLGIILRFVLMTIGHKYFHSLDFANFCNTAQLAADGKNVYACTKAYNYGPLWFTLLGILWRASAFFSDNILAFRVLFVGVLTLADILIALIISRRAGNFWGIIFFLNPISLVVTGMHNQFDNVAVVLAACGVLCVEDSSSQHSIKTSDILGIIFLSLSLIAKHIIWAFPLWILFSSEIDARKKILYAFIPPLIFLMSFAPYWIEGSEGILHNVFMYKSGNNFPLFGLGIINSLGMNAPFQNIAGLPLFGLLMGICGYIFRHEKIFNLFLIYTIAQVCFASGMASQYFVIPCMAVILLFRRKSALYFAVSIALIFACYGSTRIPLWLDTKFGLNISSVPLIMRSNIMYTAAVWCLFAYLVHHCRHKNQRVL